jgi:hypothetical protein
MEQKDIFTVKVLLLSLMQNKSELTLFDMQKIQEISEKEDPAEEDLHYLLRLKIRSQN